MSDIRLLDIEATARTDWITAANIATMVTPVAPMTIANPTLVKARYWRYGKLCWIDFDFSFDVTVNGAFLIVTLPFAPQNLATVVPALFIPAGASGICAAGVVSSLATWALTLRKYDASNLGVAVGQYYRGSGWYEIA